MLAAKNHNLAAAPVFFLSCALCFFLPQEAAAQVTFTPSSFSASSRFNDFLTVSLRNSGSDAKSVFIEILLFQNNREVFSATTNSVRLNPGTNSFNSSQLFFSTFNNTDEAFKKIMLRNDVLPSGNYQISIKVIQDEKEVELWSGENNFSIVQNPQNRNASVANKSDTSDSKKLLSRQNLAKVANGSGVIKLSSQYSDVPVPYSSLPSRYVRLESNSDLKLAGLPFNAWIFGTTEKTLSGKSLNRVQFSFDPTQFRQDLKGKLASKANLPDLSLQKKFDYKSKLEQQRNFLKSKAKEVASQADLDELKKYESLLAADTSGMLNEIGARAGKLKNRVAIPDSLDKRKEYEAKIASLKKNIAKADSVRLKLKSLEDSISILEKQINMPAGTDPAELRKRIPSSLNEKEMLKEQMKNVGSIHKIDAALLAVRSFSLGSATPTYSPLLLSGLSIKGINLELEPGIFYIAFTHGNTQNTQYLNNQKKQITAGKFGVGSVTGTHFFVGFMKGKIPDQTAPGNFGPAYDRNVAWEVDAKLQITKNTSFEAGFANSHQYFSEKKGVVNNRETPSRILNPALNDPGTAKAVSMRFLTFSPKTKTRLTVSGRMVQPNYRSFGVPYMRNDNLRFESRVDQAITKKIQLSAFYKQEEDNLIPVKRYKTVFRSMGANVTARFKKYYFVKAGYSPFLQFNREEDQPLAFTSSNQLFTLVSGFNKGVKGRTYSVVALYSLMDLRSPDYGNQYHTFNASASINCKKPLMAMGSATWTFSPSNSGSNTAVRRLMLETSVNYKIKDICTPGLGITFSNDPNGERYSGFFAECLFNVLANLMMEIKYEHRSSTTQGLDGQTQNYINAGIIRNW